MRNVKNKPMNRKEIFCAGKYITAIFIVYKKTK
jgi:hypothetical protein